MTICLKCSIPFDAGFTACGHEGGCPMTDISELIEEIGEHLKRYPFLKKKLEELKRCKPQQLQWISVDDRLPDTDKRVLISTAEGVFCGWRVEKEDDGLDTMGVDAGFQSSDWTVHPGRSFGSPDCMFEPENQPTHWMPLPGAPADD